MNLPKADMHVHLEGAIPRALVPTLARANGKLDRVPAQLLADADLRWASPAEWLGCMTAVGDACLCDPDDYARVADAFVASLRAQGVVYAEIGVGALRARKLPCGLSGVLEGVAAGLAAHASALPVGVLVALHRTSSEGEILEDLRTASAYRSRPVVGLDVQGLGPLPRERIAFLAHAAAEHALPLRVHAGELEGADEVAAVMEQPSIRRLAHGVRAAEDASVVRRLRERRVMLDVCITSNCALGLYRSIEQHPLRALFERGVEVCLGTDDPLYFETDITREYELARRVFGFSPAELVQLTRRGIERSFAAAPLKQSLLRDIDAHALADRACASTTG